MSPEVTNVIGGLVIAAVSVVLTYFFTKLLEKRKVVDYRVFSMSLLRFTPNKDRTLVVSVDKSLLTGKQEDREQQVPVNNAHVFHIVVRNVGSEDVTDATINVRLHQSAKIIEQETNPASQTNHKVSFEKDAANAVRVFAPYINRRDQFAVRLISTDNVNRYCQVNIQGLGTKTRRNSGMWVLLQFGGALMIPFLIFILLYLAFPEFYAALIRKETVTVTQEVEHIPVWLTLIVVALGAIPSLALFLYHLRNVPRNTNEFGSGGSIKVDDWGLEDLG